MPFAKAALLAAAAVLLAAPAHAKSYKVIHAFCARTNCADGEMPFSGLTADAAGNLYGTTYLGGAHGSGAVYRLSPNADKTAWSFSVLYSFCSLSACSDGEFPGPAKLIFDTQGRLYGTTVSSEQGGVAYRLTPNADPKQPWHFTLLHAFCGANGGACADGEEPYSGLSYIGAQSGAPYDGTSLLYGSTLMGGTKAHGVVYSLKPNENGAVERVLYSFCTLAQCADGDSPDGVLVVRSKNDILGTTIHGGTGAAPGGALFELKRTAAGGWTNSVLHPFCTSANCADGGEPAIGGMMTDGSGALYGSLTVGGSNNGGAAYRFDPSRGRASMLYSFCHQENCADGKLPDGDLLMDEAGTIFGTLFGGGNHGNGGYSAGTGMVYSLSGGTMTILHKFCSRTDCRDGSQPFAGLVRDSSGTLYGTTSKGGLFGGGAVFALTP